MTSGSGAPSAVLIHKLLDRLGLATPLIVLLAALGVILPFYLLQARPLTEANARLQQSQVAERVILQFTALVNQIDSLLLTMKQWGRDGRIHIDAPEAFNGLMIPVIGQQGLISSVHLASDAGREIMLLKTADGWKNRLSDLPKTGKRHHWLSWRDARTPLGDEWREQDYDMRQRPWFTGALERSEEEHLSWTVPYLFATTQEPGITASTGWTDPESGVRYVVAFDVLLMDMSRLTTQIKYGLRGQVALLTADGKILGLPHDERFKDDAAIRKAVLQKPEDLGLHLLSEAWRLANPAAEQQLFTIGEKIRGNGAWQIGLHRLPVHQQQFQVATLAPVSDIEILSDELVAVLIGVMTAIALLAMLAAFHRVSLVRRPIAQAFAELENSHRHVQAQTARRTLVANIAARLQQAHTPQQLAQTLLSELATPLAVGQALFCLWDEERQQLSALARYGGIGQTIGEIAQASAPLLQQCALTRQELILEHPENEYFYIHSGLGDMPPQAVLIQPVEHGGRLFAILELAIQRLPGSEDRTLLSDLQPIVAMSLDILLRAARTTELLTLTSAAEERSRMILEAVNSAILGLDAVGTITFVNRAALELLGTTETATIGQPLHGWIRAAHPEGEQTDLAQCHILETLRDGQPRAQDQGIFWTASGVALPVSYSTTAILRDHQVIGAVLVFQKTTAPLPQSRESHP
ncbi:MAG: GAF domain-containing protein [Magnetococcales bacterium]|nr:GAF domain-containing protein [Magnetococcales bacterium]